MQTNSRDARAATYWSWGMVLAGLVCVAARVPLLLVDPHFFAEGNVHFAYAYQHGPWEVLSFVHVEAGYFNLAPNVGAALATLLPLERAPLGPTYFALLCNLAPFVVLAFGRGAFHASRIRRAATFGALLLLPTLGITSWGNTINAQIYLGVAVLLLLLDGEEAGRTKRWWQRTLLLFAGLSGVYASVLQPVFWWRARRSGRREHRIQFILLTLTLLAQLAFASLTSYFGYQNEVRAEAVSIDALSDISTLHIGWTLLGKEAGALAASLGPAGDFLFLALLVVFAVLRLRQLAKRNDEVFDLLSLLFGAYVIWTVLVVVASFDHRPAGRYAIPPSLALATFLIAGIRFEKERVLSGVVLLLLLFGFSRGIQKFRQELPCAAQHEHAWRAEARRFEAGDPSPLPICPEGWQLELVSHEPDSNPR